MTATMEQALEILKQRYGYPAFRGSQAAIIETALAGRDCVVLMPTGGGKSICYQILGILREGLALVVSPLIALMQDQVSALRQLGFNAVFLNSTLSFHQQREIFRQLESGQRDNESGNKLEILYVAPERLLQPDTLRRLTQIKLSLIAIDEAHCVSQWGHDFRQDYLSLDTLAQHFPQTPRMALTATANQRTREEIVFRLALKKPEFFISSFDRPNIRYLVQPKLDARKQLLTFLQTHQHESGIIYCLSRKKVEQTAEWLNNKGFPALPYHAGFDSQTRASRQQRFLVEEGVIMVATIAFGMGIDKPDVRFVAHLDLPKSIESYYQETGRAGRDDLPAEAWMVYGLQDVVRLSQMLAESQANEQFKRVERSKLDALLGWCEVSCCRRIALLDYFGESRPPLEQSPCGNCDICLMPPETWDATLDAQKLLSGVVRTGQRFGAIHVIDVLRGKATVKVKQHRHNRLSTFGLGQSDSAQHWRSVIRQLIVQGYLYTDAERYGALRLTEKSRPLLRGETALTLRHDGVVAKSQSKAHSDDHSDDQIKRRRKDTPTALPGVISGGPEEFPELWDALKRCRMAFAKQNGVPPYVIFHDSTLKEMMLLRPKTLSELLTINGVGDTKLERYGERFLGVIADQA
ncbi:DNA helicase RecQ [Candidatus Spongiihabitans sp.]|uniref:DNA helicase RecQ n=1 Tax=Candidatus Spongiihabitans sp. TaxID=3101308 RepID=UPI003C7050C6